MKVGQMVPVYLDPYQNLGYEGEAELVEYMGKGLPFILDEVPDKYQVTYQHDKWKVKLNNFTCIRKIRRVVSSKGVVRNMDEFTSSSYKIDRFLEIDGKEIY